MCIMAPNEKIEDAVYTRDEWRAMEADRIAKGLPRARDLDGKVFKPKFSEA